MADVILVIQVFSLKSLFFVKGGTPASLREAGTLPSLLEALRVPSSALLLAFASQEKGMHPLDRLWDEVLLLHWYLREYPRPKLSQGRGKPFEFLYVMRRADISA